jgi:hypothetical protein
MDRNGNFTKVYVWDKNFCYEAVLGTDTDNDGVIEESEIVQNANPKQFVKIEKTTVSVSDVFEANTNPTNGDNKTNGCASTTNVQN